MPFVLLIVAVIAVIVLAVLGGRRSSRSSTERDTAVAGDSGVASTTEPDDVGTL
jgi:hypothetical protein